MKHFDSKTRREDLDKAAAPPPMPNKEEFWADFRARSAQVNRSPAAQAPAAFWQRRPLLATLSGTAAVALFVMAATLSPLLSPPGRSSVEEGPLSNVESVRVEVGYDSLMIVEDKESGGTLIWMSGMQAPSNSQPRDEQS